MTHIPAYQNQHAGAGDQATSRKGHWALRLSAPFAWGWAALVICAIAGGVGLGIASIFGAWIAFAGLMFVALSLRVAVRAGRRARGLAILGYLESAARLNLPLSVFIRAATDGERRTTRRRLLALASGLDAGGSAGAALKSFVPEIPPRIAAALASAESLGQLQPALTRLVREQSHENPEGQDFRPAAAVYPLIIGSTVLAMIASYSVYVLPKFAEIFKDFKTPIPNLLLGLDSAFNWWFGGTFGDAGGMIILLLPVALVIFLLGRSLRFTFTPWWPNLLFGHMRDKLSWQVPFWRDLQRSRAFADICHFLADAVRARVPLPDALYGASGLHMNGALRQRLLNWRTLITEGTPMAAAAAKARLPRTLVGFLAAAQAPKIAGESADDPASLAALFDFLGRYYQNRFSRLAAILRGFLEPLTTLCLGVLVAAVVLGLFLPLIAIIKSVMTGKIMGDLL